MARPAVLHFAALCALLAGASSVRGAVALAAGLLLVIAAGGVLARLVEHRLPVAARTTVVVLGTGALAASLAFAMNAMWPTLGEVPGRFLPLAVTSALLDAQSTSGTISPRRALLASLLQAVAFGLALVTVAVAREVAGRATQLALEPPGVFVLLACGIALYNHLLRGRAPPRAAAEPSA